MPRTEDPPVLGSGCTVFVIYPGTNPVDLEQLVVTPLEEAVNEVDNIKKIKTTIKDGLVNMGVNFDESAKHSEVYDDVVARINQAKGELPSDIFDFIIIEWTSHDTKILQLAFVSDSINYDLLEDKAEKLKKEITKIKGIKDADVLATPKQEVRVLMDIEKMAQMNIGINQVINAIRSNNANIPGGSVDLNQKSFSIKTSGTYASLEEIKNTAVQSYNGRLIYMKNIAEVRFDYEDIKYKAQFNGHRCVFVTATQKEGFNAFDVMEKVHKTVDEFKSTLDEEIELEYVVDQTIGIDERINGFLMNLFQGILIVGIVILLAIGFRASMVVIVAIPLSIIIGLFLVDFTGYGLQQISIAALVVALGLLVDNSIVVVENTERFLAKGYSGHEAAVKGATQVGWPIVSSTVTTLFAFAPMIMVYGAAGDFMRSLPVTVIYTLSASLLVALTLSPLMAGRFLKKQANNNSLNKKKGFKGLLRRFIEGPYRQILNYALNHKKTVIIISLIAFCGSAILFKYGVGISFFPKAEKAQFYISIHTPEGTNLKKTEEVTNRIEAVLDTISDVKFYSTSIGHGNPRVYYNIFEKSYAKNLAQIYVALYNYDVESFDVLIKKLRSTFEKFYDAQINVKEYEQGIPVEAPVAIKITGDEIDILRKIATDIEDIVKNIEGSVNTTNTLKSERTDIFVNIDKDKAAMFGVPVSEIDKTVRACMNGLTVDKFRNKEGDEFGIVLRMDNNGKTKVSDFYKVYVQSLSGKMIQLNQLANIQLKKVPAVITHYNMDRCATVQGDVKKGYTAFDITTKSKEILKDYPFPAGYSYLIEGESEEMTTSFSSMFRAMGFAVIGIFAVLVLQFKSLSQPLIIYSSIPLAIIGSILALFITGHTFSFTGLIGLISLVGIVINNSIILVDYSNELIRKQGKSIDEAIQLASETRFTPIILTTLTTVGGLLPLTLSGSSMWAPMGWLIIGGLIVSTMLTLIVVPVLYKIFK